MIMMDPQVTTLQQQIGSLSSELQNSEEKRKEVEKEQEDLLVLLDEVNSKRRRDKALLRTAGLEVSEDEGEDDGEDGS
jgi:intracellular protein transport protein USO1